MADRAHRVRWLADRFSACFSAEPIGWRTVGREAEHPVVYPDGSAASIEELWPELLAVGDLTARLEGDVITLAEGPRYSFSAEVGRGTMEIICAPCQDLHELAALYVEARDRLVCAAGTLGLRVLGYGVQPVTAGSSELMSPKQRYGVLHEVLGDPWLWFTLTASDQVHVAISRGELVPVTNLCNALSAVVVALCANSPICEGTLTGVRSAREWMMGSIHKDTHRHGPPGLPFHDVSDLIEHAIAQPWLIRKRDGIAEPRRGAFGDACTGELDDQFWRDFLDHEHYIWNSARPRSAHGTLELRAACQQPKASHMSPAALALAMVEGWRDIEQLLLEHLGREVWTGLCAWHVEAIHLGLEAREPSDGLIGAMLERCRSALERRGRGEEMWLDPLDTCLRTRREPAAEALKAFESGGMAGLVDHVSL